MAAIELAPEVGDDLERILDHLLQHQAAHIERRLQEIIEAIDVLEYNPLIGRPVERGKRELVIGSRSHGYIALYRYLAEIDRVLVLAVRRAVGCGEVRTAPIAGDATATDAVHCRSPASY